MIGSVSALCRVDDQLGEGPLWDHRAHRLLWIDILRGVVHSWSPTEGASDLLRVDALIGSIALAPEDDLLLATSQGLMRWHEGSDEIQSLDNPNEGQPVRFNDGRVDAAGRFWVGTMALDPARYAEPLGMLYRFDPDGSLHQMDEGLTISNGLDWSPDGRTFYLTDTMRRLIYAYDFDERAGTIHRRRLFVSLEEAEGFPDGLVVDREGCVWSACLTGSCIKRYAPDGRLMKQVVLPVSCPTSLTFGGPDFSEAFITTSRHLLDVGHRETDAGSLLTVSLCVRGRPAAVFGQGGSE
jgi:sugar lactone lactonase YvrE